MPRPRSDMRKIREVLRLNLVEGLSQRQISKSIGLPRTTIREYLSRARQDELGWPLPEGLDDRQLEERLFGRPGPRPTPRPEPDWLKVHQELKRRGVTLQLLHLEYREENAEGWQYSQFCVRYRLWQRHLDVVMRQEHRGGEKGFVDFAGQRLAITDGRTGEKSWVELFVGVLGASSYTYAELVPSQAMPHWIGAHVRMFEYFGGVPKVTVCDNLKAGVVKAHRYEPELNATYLEMASHYGCAIMPARSRKPRDKAKVEAAVLIAERWILARLRNRTFFSIEEANGAVRELLEDLNQRPFKKLPGSRRSHYEDLDRPLLKQLPARAYEYAAWRKATVNIDYHLEVDRHWYSVPYQLVGQRCDVRLTAATVEVLLRGRRVASHVRSQDRYRHTTLPEHMPDSHRRHAEWTPGRILNWAQSVGPKTTELMQAVMDGRPHPEQGYRSCLGILRLAQRHGPERLEAACSRALAIDGLSFRSVDSILRTGLDRQSAPPVEPSIPQRPHENLRGADYYT